MECGRKSLQCRRRVRSRTRRREGTTPIGLPDDSCVWDETRRRLPERAARREVPAAVAGLPGPRGRGRRGSRAAGSSSYEAFWRDGLGVAERGSIGCFLARPLRGLFSRFDPARARVGPWGGTAETLTTQSLDPSSLRLRFCLSSRRNWSTPALRQSLKRRRHRRPSPHHRIIRRLSPGAYSVDSPTWDGGGHSPVMT